jgi:hypothetical protein
MGLSTTSIAAPQSWPRLADRAASATIPSDARCARRGDNLPLNSEYHAAMSPRMHDLLNHYGQLSSAIGDRTGASDSLLHVHGGLVVMFLARVLTRRSLASWTPFLFVFAAALLKEGADRWAHGSWRMPDTLFDIINTIFWPLVLMVGLRRRRARPDRV